MFARQSCGHLLDWGVGFLTEEKVFLGTFKKGTDARLGRKPEMRSRGGKGGCPGLRFGV